MSASPIVIPPSVRSSRWRWSCLLLIPPTSLVGASWWLTAPLEDIPTAPPAVSHSRPETKATDSTPASEEATVGPSRLARSARWRGSGENPAAGDASRGRQATRSNRRLHRDVPKTERLHGVLGDEQTLAMKVRQRPFAVYLKFLNPQAGKEVVYAEGHHENKVIAHSTGVARLLVPRLAVPPDHPLAMAETRHAITEAGPQQPERQARRVSPSRPPRPTRPSRFSTA